MKLREVYGGRAAKPPLSIEFFPPKTAEGERRFWRNFPSFKSLKPAFCSVTYSTTGVTHNKSVEIVERIKQQEGIEVMCHLTCLGRTSKQVRAILDELVHDGIDNLIALRGDVPKDDTGWTPAPGGFRNAIELVREALTYKWFSVAVAGFPETHPDSPSPEKDIENLKAKVDAGADVVITQLFFDNADFLRYRDRVKAAGIGVPVVPGIMPIRSVKHLERITGFGGVKVPAILRDELAKYAADDPAAAEFGIDYCIRQCRGLLAYGIPGLHFFSFNEPHPLVTIVHGIGLGPS